jgi:hypothetical protein
LAVVTRAYVIEDADKLDPDFLGRKVCVCLPPGHRRHRSLVVCSELRHKSAYFALEGIEIPGRKDPADSAVHDFGRANLVAGDDRQTGGERLTDNERPGLIVARDEHRVGCVVDLGHIGSEDASDVPGQIRVELLEVGGVIRPQTGATEDVDFDLAGQVGEPMTQRRYQLKPLSCGQAGDVEEHHGPAVDRTALYPAESANVDRMTKDSSACYLDPVVLAQ